MKKVLVLSSFLSLLQKNIYMIVLMNWLSCMNINSKFPYVVTVMAFQQQQQQQQQRIVWHKKKQQQQSLRLRLLPHVPKQQQQQSSSLFVVQSFVSSQKCRTQLYSEKENHLDPSQDVSSSYYYASPSTSTSTTTSTTSMTNTTTTTTTTSTFVVGGDDSAYFNWKNEKLSDWIQFGISVSTVLAIVVYVWLPNIPYGLHGGDAFVQFIQQTILGSDGSSSDGSSSGDGSDVADPAQTISIMLLLFAVAHSGLASLRTYAEPMVGAKIWRWVFALVSLPLAFSCLSYFINHGGDGKHLWTIIHPDDPWIHSMLFVTNFVSFLFLYPSTFNLLEIAAVTEPQLHLWETGIIRITRHPQAVGQFLWCLAHTAYLGTTTAVAASTVLLLHHAFAVYHGDRRLEHRHGTDKFQRLQSTTSVIPFAAILDGRQKLPPDYYKEFLRLPYAVVVIGTIGAYFAHPYMRAGAALMNW